jgi:hypothetical protein
MQRNVPELAVPWQAAARYCVPFPSVNRHKTSDNKMTQPKERLHPGSTQKVNDLILKCIEKSSVYGEALHVGEIGDLLKGINKELEKKSIRTWLSIPEIHSIYTSLANRRVSGLNEGRLKNGSFFQAFGEDAAKALSADILEYLISIPRQYDISLHVLNTPSTIPNITKISKNISFETRLPFQISTETTSGKILQAISPFVEKNVVLRYNVQGYCGGSLENPSNRQALSSFKILLQQALFHNAFTIDTSTFSNPLKIKTPDLKIKKFALTANEINSEQNESNTATLPIEICAHLEKFRFPQRKIGKLFPISDSELNILIKSFKRTGLLLDCPDKEAIRVRAAIEWSFDADAAETSTMSFIKTCIGLEALLGDDKKEGSLNETLADRCAYLVGRTIKDRAQIKSRFKEIYVIRSKIVHGVTSHLAHEELVNLHHGKLYLKEAIQAEISHLGIE